MALEEINIFKNNQERCLNEGLFKRKTLEKTNKWAEIQETGLNNELNEQERQTIQNIWHLVLPKKTMFF